jgi:hypothetical protein
MKDMIEFVDQPMGSSDDWAVGPDRRRAGRCWKRLRVSLEALLIDFAVSVEGVSQEAEIRDEVLDLDRRQVGEPNPSQP